MGLNNASSHGSSNVDCALSNVSCRLLYDALCDRSRASSHHQHPRNLSGCCQGHGQPDGRRHQPERRGNLRRNRKQGSPAVNQGLVYVSGVDRSGCIQPNFYLPSYVEWLTCFEMNKSVREGRREGGVTSELINPDGSVTMPPVGSLGIMGSVTRSYAQSGYDVPKRVQGGVQSAAVKAAESEWNKLPTDELACANQKLTARGDSVPSLAKRGVLPSDARVADIRAQCISSSSPAPSPTVAQAAQQSPPQKPSSPPQQQPSSPSQQQPSSDEQARQQEALTNLNQPVESLKTDLAASTARVAELEKGKAAAESALKQAEQARSDAQKAQHETDQARNADKAQLDAVTAQFEAYKASADANTDWRWAYAGIGGLIGLIAGLIPFLFTNWRRVWLRLRTQ